ncbi:MAG: hypothetical protein IID36_00365 [Planctomycetes bacterium]|nr:hypothetical protein [Planctomycetota bacterium]
MKGLITLAVIGLLIAMGAIYATGEWAFQDSGHLIAFACGNPSGDTVELQVAIPYRMTRLDPPRLDPQTGRFVRWSQWIEEHFELNDAAGNRIPLRRSNFANLIPQRKVGTPDFYLSGSLPADSSFSFDYLPIGIAQSKRYRYEFSITEEGRPFERVAFELVP